MFEKIKAKAQRAFDRAVQAVVGKLPPPPPSPAKIDPEDIIQHMKAPSLTVSETLALAALIKAPGFRRATPARRKTGVHSLLGYAGSVRPGRISVALG